MDIWSTSLPDILFRDRVEEVIKLHSAGAIYPGKWIETPLSAKELLNLSYISPLVTGYVTIDQRISSCGSQATVRDLREALLNAFTELPLLYFGAISIWHLGPIHLYFVEGFHPHKTPESSALLSSYGRLTVPFPTPI